jgi:hypothetical protein
MLKTYSFLYLICAIVVTSCKREQTYQPLPGAIPVIVDQNLYDQIAPQQQAPVSIDTAMVEGDLLDITVSYPGGCEEHTFGMIVSEFHLKKNPPVFFAVLTHDVITDTCTLAMRDTLRFDLTPFKLYLQQVLEYGGPAYIKINVGGQNQQRPPFKVVRVLYKF